MGADMESDEESEGFQEGQDEPPVISADLSHIYALDGRQREDDIELRGLIGDSPVRVLVDTRSSHNFLHPDVAEKLALPLRQIRPFRVYAGNGESLLCSFASVQTRLVIQKHVVLVDLHILPVHGPDVILGRIWLKQMRRVTSDYVDGTLEFTRNGKIICLKLVPPSAEEVYLRTFSSLLTLQGGAEVYELVQAPTRVMIRRRPTEHWRFHGISQTRFGACSNARRGIWSADGHAPKTPLRPQDPPLTKHQTG